METTKPRTVSSIGMFDMLKGAGMLTIVFAHTAELYSLQSFSGLSLTAFFPNLLQHMIQLVKPHAADDAGDITQICHKYLPENKLK